MTKAAALAAPKKMMTERRSKRLELAGSAVLAGVGALLIFRSIRLIHAHYLVPLFWDDWDFVINLVDNPLATKTVGYLFRPHNEHIITTTKLLVWIDYWLFQLTTAPLILLNVLMTLANAWLLAHLALGDGRGYSRIKFIAILVLGASGLSLAQWENLVWGFQLQFSLVMLFSLISIILAIGVVKAATRWKTLWLSALLSVSLGAAVFSLGAGAALPLAIAVLFVMLRCPVPRCWPVIAIGMAYTVVFLVLTRHGPALGDTSLETPENLAIFFFAVIGMPVRHGLGWATIVGLLLCIVLGAAFARCVAVPWLRSRPIDRHLAGLFAFAGFLLALAAGIAVARTPLGLGQVSAPRYAGPTLALWMASILIVGRALLLGADHRAARSNWGLLVCLAVALSLAGWSSLRPINRPEMMIVQRRVLQAAYFIASGVEPAVQLSALYGQPGPIVEPIAFLRRNRLNIFADRTSLAMPPADEVAAIAAAPALPSCPFGHLDKLAPLGEEASEAIGWAADQHSRAPLWVLGFDQAGRLLGFTVPLVPRPDVSDALSIRGEFLGFDLPLRVGSKSTPPIVAAIMPPGDETPCRLQ